LEEYVFRKLLIEKARVLGQKDFFPASDGNFSVLLNQNEVLITPAGKSKSELKELDLVVIDRKGRLIRGEIPASTEWEMHLAVYHERKEIQAVLHAHPPYATAFALAHIPLDIQALPEIITTIGNVPLCEYAKPGTAELGVEITKHITRYDAVLLKNHGVLTLGKDIDEAFFNMQRVEHFAKVLFLARQLGNVNALSPEQIANLNS